MPYCSAYNCRERAGKGPTSFHSFPKDVKLKKKWLEMIRRENFTPTVHSKLCSNHFKEEDFERHFGLKKLRKGAVPSKFVRDKDITPKQKHTAQKSSKKTRQRLAEANAETAALLPTYDEIQGVLYHARNSSRKKLENKDPSLKTEAPALKTGTPAPKTGTPQNKKREFLPKDSNRSPPETPKLICENDDYEISGSRIVNINYFFQQLMQLNKHGPPGCSLNNLNIISETRRGLASEIKFKCSKCNFEKSIWTEEVSSQFPLSLNTAAVTGTIGIKNGLAAMEDFLDVLNVPSVSINTTYAAKRDKGRTAEEDADQEGFTVVVKGTWEKRTPRTKQPEASSEKPPEMDSDWKSSEKRPEAVLVSNPLERRPVVVLESKPDLFMEVVPNSVRTIVSSRQTPSDMVVELDAGTQTSEVILPDLSKPGPSNRMEPDSSMMEQDVHMAMACDIYTDHESQPDPYSKIKEEPKDSGTRKQDFLSATVAQDMIHSSNESVLTSNQKGSLFHPPVLIKEEPVYFEES